MSKDQEDVNIKEELNIKEEYELWRKNCRYMYEFVSETALTWPSLTVQWLPEHDVGDVVNAKLLLGTHTSGKAQNYLKLATTKLPVPLAQKKPKVSSIIKISKKFETSSEINRARYMPQNHNIVASINGNGECDIFDLDSNNKMGHFAPHTENGYGLSWNMFEKGLLATSSDDKTVAITDTNKICDESASVIYTAHTDIVNDVKWSNSNAHIFGSVSDDRNLLLYDSRVQESISGFRSTDSKGINSIAFSPFSANLLAIGNANSNINLLDIRKMSSSGQDDCLLHTMMGHGDSITCLEFSPGKDGILASGSQDRRVFIWDLSKIGEEQSQEDAEDGASEIFMMHAGHTGAVTDLSWCPFMDWTLASVADDNIVHLWQIGKSLVESESPDLANTTLE